MKHIFSRFIWYVNGRKVLPSTPNVEFHDPSNIRSIVRFKLPESGDYTVVAQNEFGIAKSNAYIEIEKGKFFAVFIDFFLKQLIVCRCWIRNSFALVAK